MSIKKVRIKVHPNSSQEKIEEKEDLIEIWTKEKPIEGKANEKVIKLLKKYLNKKVTISSGFESKFKTIEFEE